MKTLYLAIGYVCNLRCVFCPCSEGAGKMPSFTFDEICKGIDLAIENRHIENILLSGGEPTIHPDFFRIVEYIRSKGLMLSMLTNAQKLADNDFCEKLLQTADCSKLDVTVAFLSHNAAKHDRLTQVPGSFDRSLAGVRQLIAHGVRTTIKNNIVNYTYRDLPDFIRWVNQTFPPEATLLLVNIDVNGVALGNKNLVGVEFSESMPYLMAALDQVIADRRIGIKRNVKVLTTPMCLIDPYYWGFIENKTRDTIDAYKVPSAEISNNPLQFDVGSDSGPMFKACQGCDLRSICPGAWRSFKEVYDESILTRICAE